MVFAIYCIKTLYGTGDMYVANLSKLGDIKLSILYPLEASNNVCASQVAALLCLLPLSSLCLVVLAHRLHRCWIVLLSTCCTTLPDKINQEQRQLPSHL